MTRLLYLSNARLPTEKAHGGQIMQMCAAFADAGAEVTLWHPRRVNLPDLAAQDPFTHYGVPRNFAVRTLPCLDGFPLAHRLGDPAPLLRAAFVIQVVTYALAALWRLPRARADLFYTRESALLLLLALSGRGRRTVYEAHRLPGSRLGRAVQRWALRGAAGVVALTRQLADDYAALGAPAGRIVVAPDAVQWARFATPPDKADARRALGVPAGALVAGYVGRFHTMDMPKGLDTLVEAAARTDAVHVCLVGGPAETVGELRARGTLPDARLIYLGQVPPGEVPRCLAAFDVCVMPFPWTRHFAYYASPIKLFEYMASGRPLVATDLPSTREIVAHEVSVLLVPPDDPEALAAALRRLRDDPALGARLAAEARALVAARYTWKARAAGILKSVESPFSEA